MTYKDADGLISSLFVVLFRGGSIEGLIPYIAFTSISTPAGNSMFISASRVF